MKLVLLSYKQSLEVSTYNNRSARLSDHLSELVMMVILCRAQVRLACRQSRSHLHIQESVCHAKTFLHLGKVHCLSLARL